MNTPQLHELKLKAGKQSRINIQNSIESWFKNKLSRTRKQSPHKVAKNVTLNFLMGLWTKQNGKCALSGVKMDTKRRSMFSVTMDRIDSKLAYTRKNIQLTSLATNFAKSDFSQSMALKWFRAIRSR